MPCGACASSQMKEHPSSGAAFDPYRRPDDMSAPRVFPYGPVAHEGAARIQRAWHRYNHRYVRCAPCVLVQHHVLFHVVVVLCCVFLVAFAFCLLRVFAWLQRIHAHNPLPLLCTRVLTPLVCARVAHCCVVSYFWFGSVRFGSARLGSVRLYIFIFLCFGSKDAAATRFQALFRGHMVRVPFYVSRLLTLAAVIRIQSLLRVGLAKAAAHRRWCRHVFPAAAGFQACWRGLLARRRVAHLRRARAAAAAVALQRVARGWMARRDHVVRGVKAAHRAALLRMRASVVVQRLARGFLGRCAARWRLGKAVVIMRWWRDVVCVNLAAARLLQRLARGFLGRRRVKHLRATALQAGARGMLARLRVAELKARARERERGRAAEEAREAARNGDVAVESKREFLVTKTGKGLVKAERRVVKAARKEASAARKGMSEQEKRRWDARDAFLLFDTDASEEIDLEEFQAIMEELCMPYVVARCRTVLCCVVLGCVSRVVWGV